MTLEEAIKVLGQYSHEPEAVSLEDETNAIQLGIEALEREQISRHEIPYYGPGLLPSETEE
jgi:hypothetical protein